MYETLIQLPGDYQCTWLRVSTEEAIWSRLERKMPYCDGIKRLVKYVLNLIRFAKKIIKVIT